MLRQRTILYPRRRFFGIRKHSAALLHTVATCTVLRGCSWTRDGAGCQHRAPPGKDASPRSCLYEHPSPRLVIVLFSPLGWQLSCRSACTGRGLACCTRSLGPFIDASNSNNRAAYSGQAPSDVFTICCKSKSRFTWISGIVQRFLSFCGRTHSPLSAKG